MKHTIDIYDQQRRLRNLIRLYERAPLPARSKALIFEFQKALVLEDLSIARQVKYLTDFKAFIMKYLPKKDLDQLSDGEIRDAVLRMEQDGSYSPWTKHGFKVVIRKFFKWLAYGDDYLVRKEYPRCVSWITPNIKKKDRPKVKASDLLTEEEVSQMIERADTIRDRALLSLLYELGARIGEMGKLKIKDVTRQKHGFLVDLDGKTGNRTPLAVMSTVYLSGWLSAHPNSNNPESPLWVSLMAHTRGRELNYTSLRSLLDRVVRRAGIKKRVYPHLFRHSRVTHLLSKGLMNEAQAKVYFGWVPDSRMLSEYAHLVCGDVHKAILAMHGIVDDEKKDTPSLRCIACASVNPLNATFCLRCGSALKVMDGEDADKENRALIEKFLADPAVLQFLQEKAKVMGIPQKV